MVLIFYKRILFLETYVRRCFEFLFGLIPLSASSDNPLSSSLEKGQASKITLESCGEKIKTVSTLVRFLRI